nr:hypothetical protein Iba_chr05cCG19700 [Ipomoea batatas]
MAMGIPGNLVFEQIWSGLEWGESRKDGFESHVMGGLGDYTTRFGEHFLCAG